MADTKTTDLSAITGANTAVGDLFVVVDVSDTTQGASGSLKSITRAELAAAMLAEGLPSIAIISDTKAASTDGGTFTSGAWQTRDLQTEDYDPDGIVSITSNQFTLQAGTYLIRAEAPAYAVDAHAARLQNITDTTTDLLGTSSRATNDTKPSSSSSSIDGVITIAGAKAFEIQHQCNVTKASQGFGLSVSYQSSIYTRVKITKLA